MNNSVQAKDVRATDRRSLLKQIAVLPAAAAIVSCDHNAESKPTTPPPNKVTRQFVNPPGLVAIPEVFSNVIRVGQMVFVTAQLPLDENLKPVPADDINGQVRQCWKNVETALKSVGGGLKDVVMCQTYITSPDYWSHVSDVRSQVFRGLTPPTTSRPIVVRVLSGIEGVHVSIGVIAMITD